MSYVNLIGDNPLRYALSLTVDLSSIVNNDQSSEQISGYTAAEDPVGTHDVDNVSNID